MKMESLMPASIIIFFKELTKGGVIITISGNAAYKYGVAL